MAANMSPIFTLTPVVDLSPVLLTTAAADYNGLSGYNAQVFKAGANGSYLQKLRFKALGTNVATVARVYFTPGTVGHMASLVPAPGTPSGTPSTTGGTLLAGTGYYAQIVAVDATGALSTLSAASSAVTVTGTTGSIAWSWTASAGAASYRIYVGQTATALNGYFTSATNSFTQTTPQEAQSGGATDGIPTITNNLFWDEIALPATTATATTNTATIELPINIALPANTEVYVGLGTTVAAGWQVTSVGGSY